MSIGIALAGGGVKGAAHIGALKALEEKNIKIDYIGGTSSGSIVSTLYAAGFTPDEIYEMEGSDLTIKIKSEKISLLDMTKIDELYKLGYETIKQQI